MAYAPATASGVDRFNWADYLVLGVYLGLLTIMGFVIAYRERHNVSSKNFLTGGRSMHWFPVALSMQGSMISAITILSIPAEMYNYGTMYYFIALGGIIGLSIAAHMYLPIIYNLRLISCYEYLERRFSNAARIVGSLTYFTMVILYLPVVLYTPSIALAQVSGLSIGYSVLVSGVICTLYTMLGGLKASIWTDLLQMSILLIGYIMIIIIGSIRVGGISEVFDIAERGGRIIFNEFTPNLMTRSTFYSQLFGGTLVYLTSSASNQSFTQKFSSVSTLKNAQKSIYFMIFTSLIYLTSICLIGLIMYAYYIDCDPRHLHRITTSDQLLPLFVMDIMGNLHGLPGLFMATVFSAALSTTSGCLNALTAITIEDYFPSLYALKYDEPISEKTKTILTRILVIVYGVITIGLGNAAQYLGDSVNQISLSIYGFVGGPLTAMITLGVFIPFINSWGAISGLIAALAISSWIAIGTIFAKIPPNILPADADNCTFESVNFTIIDNYTIPPGMFSPEPNTPNDVLWIYRVSYMHYSFIAFAIAFIVATPVSLITGRSKNLDSNLTYNFKTSFCKPCRKKLNLYDDEEKMHESEMKESISSKSASSEFTNEKRIIDEIEINSNAYNNQALNVNNSEF